MCVSVSVSVSLRVCVCICVSVSAEKGSAACRRTARSSTATSTAPSPPPRTSSPRSAFLSSSSALGTWEVPAGTSGVPGLTCCATVSNGVPHAKWQDHDRGDVRGVDARQVARGCDRADLPAQGARAGRGFGLDALEAEPESFERRGSDLA
eukprot:3226840-Rhodomonas_salina.1